MGPKNTVRRKTVKEILQDNKLLTEEQLLASQEESKKTGEPLQSVVVRFGLMSRVDLLRTLSQEWGVKAVNLDEIEIDPETVKVIPEAAARRHRAVPFVKEDNALFVAMADPRDFFVIEDIQLRTNFEVQPYLALPRTSARSWTRPTALPRRSSSTRSC
jgi:type IV pilus assembly protein PilB